MCCYFRELCPKTSFPLQMFNDARTAPIVPQIRSRSFIPHVFHYVLCGFVFFIMTPPSPGGFAEAGVDTRLFPPPPPTRTPTHAHTHLCSLPSGSVLVLCTPCPLFSLLQCVLRRWGGLHIAPLQGALLKRQLLLGRAKGNLIYSILTHSHAYTHTHPHTRAHCMHTYLYPYTYSLSLTYTHTRLTYTHAHAVS